MMKRSAIALALAVATSFGAVQSASAGDNTRFSLAVGPAWTNTDLLEGDALSGFSLQYKFEWRGSRVGLVGSIMHTGHSGGYTVEELPGITVDADMEYNSFAIGPSYRINKYVSLYSQFGVAEGRVEVDRVSDSQNSVSIDASTSATAIVYGLGAHLQPDRNLFFNLYYERAAGDLETDSFSVGLGYMF
jgi:opacity protein-like surface antigen